MKGSEKRQNFRWFAWYRIFCFSWSEAKQMLMITDCYPYVYYFKWKWGTRRKQNSNRFSPSFRAGKQNKINKQNKTKIILRTKYSQVPFLDCKIKVNYIDKAGFRYTCPVFTFWYTRKTKTQMLMKKNC